MQFISDSKSLVSIFKRLCSKYNHYMWSVAWAGEPHGFDLAQVLSRNERKIENIVVGLHFYQTSPSFIKRFVDNRNVKFYMQSDGTFHAKVYLFYNTSNDWSAIIGSSNFTSSGFHNNEEANVVIDNSDTGITFKELYSFISNIWKNAEYFTSEQLSTYSDTHCYQQRKHKSLSQFTKQNRIPTILEVMTWEEYIGNISTSDISNYEARLKMLDKAHEYFASGVPFDNLASDVKKALAGFIVDLEDTSGKDIDWLMFGSMKGAGTFKHAINNNIKIGKALDAIPLYGKVSRKQFDDYCKVFKDWKNPIACATRLLAIKRPDLFLCVNSKNKKELSRLLNIKQSQFTLDNYWDVILMPIYNSLWFKDGISKPNKLESDVKRFQVAMLDSISYRY